MTRLFLAAGVAVMAIAAPAAAGPGGHGGGGGGPQRADRPQQAQPQRVQRAQAAPQRAERMIQAPRMERMQAPRMERMQAERIQPQRMAMQSQRMERVRPMRAQRVQAEHVQQPQVQRTERVQARQTQRDTRVQQAQTMRADRMQQAQSMRANRVQQAQTMRMDRIQQVQANPNAGRLNAANNAGGVGYGVGGCPPGLADKGCMPPGQAAKLNTSRLFTAENAQLLRNAQVAGLGSRYGTTILAPATAVSLLGTPYSQARTIAGLNPMPLSAQYLYPDTPNYYYQYGNGYAYQVDRSSSLISALIPLLAGGYMPGQYLPQSYMSSNVPNYYGLNSFYPTSYDSGYGYGSNYGNGYDNSYGSSYSNLCNRYMNGVVYQVDCVTGMVQDVVPLYASGYGVGQMMPSSYDNYNLPYQYRSLYPASADTGYWYAPGAIYQYDQSSNLITSVASLLAPGMTVGQQLPMGYDAYNVPYAYRNTYADTSDAWYRYNNGNIYQVDPSTQLVSAVVASILT